MRCNEGVINRAVGSFRRMPNKIGDKNLTRIVLSPTWKIELFEEENFAGESIVIFNTHHSAKKSVKFRDA
jgi:hypothetical protein